MNTTYPITDENQNIHDEEFLSSSSDEDAFLFDDNLVPNILHSDEPNVDMLLINPIDSLSQIEEQTESSLDTLPTNTSEELNIYLKQAKGRDDQFDTQFPASLLCHPYKYDLKVVGHLENYQQSKLTLNLVDAETLVIPNVSLPNKKTVEAVSVEQIEELNTNERVIRFTFNLCSFHFKRRAFRLELTQNTNGASKRLFLSEPFQTFARRREHHQSLNNLKVSTEMKTVTSPESNTSSTIQSPKSDKQGVKRSISNVTNSSYPSSKTRLIAPNSPISPQTTNATITHPTVLNASAVPPHFAGAYAPYMYSANFAAAAAYHQEMAQQYAAALPVPPYNKVPMYYPQWTAPSTFNNQLVFGSPYSSPTSTTSPVSPPLSQENSQDKITSPKKERVQIHHKPLNFVQPATLQTAPVPPYDNYFTMDGNDRASLAIHLLKTLSPMERQTVNYFMNGNTPNV